MATRNKSESVTIPDVVENSEAQVENITLPQTTAPVDNGGQYAVYQREQKRASLTHSYRTEEKKAITISPFYAPYLGKVVRLSLNGIEVHVPADGRTYDVPASFSAEWHAKRMAIDELVLRQTSAADAQRNFEGTAGELKLF